MQIAESPQTPAFYGKTVIRASFVLALFGWGIGFYGPPIFVHEVVQRTGWSLTLVSSAVTFHFVFGAVVVTFLPRAHQRMGVALTTAAGATSLAFGVLGWAMAAQEWQLFLAAMFTGAGWTPMGAAGINTIVSRWFAKKRPMALATAYNGASVGGMLMTPLWATLIGPLGFPVASVLIACGMWVVVVPMAFRVFSQVPDGHQQFVDGLVPTQGEVLATPPISAGGRAQGLWSDRAFVTLAAAMALGLFAQIGLLTQLFSLMVPVMGVSVAAWVMSLATGCGMAGRLVVARLIGAHADRRRAASVSYAIQLLGTMALLLCGAGQHQLVILGVLLFGFGIGNASSLPPLIAQTEFSKEDVPRVVARCVALAQGLFAFAPVFFALMLTGNSSTNSAFGVDTNAFFLAVIAAQCVAIICMLLGRRASK